MIMAANAVTIRSSIMLKPASLAIRVQSGTRALLLTGEGGSFSIKRNLITPGVVQPWGRLMSV